MNPAISAVQLTEEKGKDFKDMSKNEKKKFLSMDLIDRMIRVEQRVSSSFHKYVPYNETEYYRSLKSGDKIEYEKFLRRKKKKNLWLSSSLFLPVLTFFGANFGITGLVTGNVISEEAGGTISSFAFWLSAGLFAIISLILVSFWVHQSRRGKAFDKHAKILEDIYLKKHLGGR